MNARCIIYKRQNKRQKIESSTDDQDYVPKEQNEVILTSTPRISTDDNFVPEENQAREQQQQQVIGNPYTIPTRAHRVCTTNDQDFVPEENQTIEEDEEQTMNVTVSLRDYLTQRNCPVINLNINLQTSFSYITWLEKLKTCLAEKELRVKYIDEGNIVKERDFTIDEIKKQGIISYSNSKHYLSQDPLNILKRVHARTVSLILLLTSTTNKMYPNNED